MEQLRQVAILIVEDSHNDSIISEQSCIIEEQGLLIESLDTTVSKQKTIIANQTLLLAHSETLIAKGHEISKIELEVVKTKHLKQKKLGVIVVAILVAIIILK